MATTHNTPTLDEVADDPTLALELPSTAIAGLLAKCAALQSALAAALLDSRQRSQNAADGEDRLLTVDEAAAKLSVTREWLYRRGKRLGSRSSWGMARCVSPASRSAPTSKARRSQLRPCDGGARLDITDIVIS